MTNEKFWDALHDVGAGFYKFIGLIISGLLISFGAPFWHDFIGTFTGLRKTLRGKKEEKKEKEGNGGSTTPTTVDKPEEMSGTYL